MSSFRSSQVYDVDGEIDTSQQSRYNRQLSEYDEEIQRAQEEEEEDRRQAYQQQQSNIRRANSSTPGLKRAASSSGSSRRVGAAPTVDRSQSLTSSSSSSSSQRHGRGFSQLDPDMAKNFKVVVRIRPPLPRELDGRGTNGPVYRDIVRTEDQNCGITICENGIQSKDGFNTTTTTNPDGTLTHSTNTNSGVYATHKFTFDYVYDQDAQQADVYNNTAKDAVLSTLQGYNATILAYGQTGTGKTFSMEGFESYELRGIIPRSVEEIFNYEVISDLLKPERSNLNIREDKKKGVYVEGLSEWVVRSPKEVYGLIKRGTSLRATGSTRINETSSRSHALFIIIVEQNEMIYEEDKDAVAPTPGMDKQEKARTVAGSNTLIRQSFKVGKLNLVDLAGSERVRISGAKGRRLEESKHINQSLSALGNVISALTEGGRSHVPYRDSKLTRILEDSFGGNVRCTLLAMISPAQESFLESLSTLKFANRAKHIQNVAKVNEDLDEKALLRRYERELKKLRQELQAKSKNVVDKRKLIEVEEQRRRAEQDKMTALMNMERLSRDLLTEKNQKKKLEERIKEMNSQLLVGGLNGSDEDPNSPTNASSQAENQKAFQQALQLEQDRIRQQYSEKLQELEKEREQMEEEKAQTSRYKQLLLKQRDIMIQLTARLNERDQSILLLQEELDAYDKHQRAMEDELDQKRHRLIQLQRMNVGGPVSAGGVAALGVGDGMSADPASPTSSSSTGVPSSAAHGQNLYGLFPIDEAPYFEEHSLSPLSSPGPATREREGGPGSPTRTNSTSTNFTPDLEAELQRRVAIEVARRDRERDSFPSTSPSSSSSSSASSAHHQQQLSDLSDSLRAKESEAMRLREELDRLRRQASVTPVAQPAEVASLTAALKSQDEYAASLLAQNAALQQSLAQAQARLSAAHSSAPSVPSVEDRALRDNLAVLKRKYDVQVQERTALKVILEKKMKALIDSIATAALGGGKGATNADGSQSAAATAVSALPSRTKREIEVLQRLVEASLTALKNSDGDAQDNTNGTQQPTGAATPASQPTSTPPPVAAPRPIGISMTPTPPLPSPTSAPAMQQYPPRTSLSASPPSSIGLSHRPHHDAPSASSLDGIELLIQQRKAELMRLDERMR